MDRTKTWESKKRTSWTTILDMIDELVQTLSTKTNGRPCTNETLHSWIINSFKDCSSSPDEEDRESCDCEDECEGSACVNDFYGSDFWETYSKGIYRIAKKITANRKELSHTGPEVIPVKLRKLMIGNAQEWIPSHDWDEDEEEEGDDSE